MTTRSRSRAGLTFTELLVVIAIIGLFVGLLLPGIQKVRGTSGNSRCQNNVKQLVLAVHNYASTYGDKLPPANAALADTQVGGTLLWYLLPYLEEDPLWRASQGTGGTYCIHAPLKALQCPSDVTNWSGFGVTSRQATSSYSANFQIFGTGRGTIATPPMTGEVPAYTIANIPSGTSNIVMWSEASACTTSGCVAYATFNGNYAPLFAVGEMKESYPPRVGTWIPQFNPTGISGDYPAWYGQVQGYHRDTLIVGMADGSTRGISARISTVNKPHDWPNAVIPHAFPSSDW